MATSQQAYKGGSNRNRRGGGRGGNPNNRNRSGNRSSRGRSQRSRPVPRKAPEPSFGQKLLSILTFGLLGKPTPPRRPASRKSARTDNAAPRRNQSKAGNNGKARPSRAPEAVEVTTERLYVGNLSYDASESDLTELFTGVGTVASAEVVCHRRTQRSKGYAFVRMNTIDEARRAVEVLHDKDFMGRKLVVSGAKSSGIRESDEDS